MSPTARPDFKELFQELTRLLSADCGKTTRIRVRWGRLLGRLVTGVYIISVPSISHPLASILTHLLNHRDTD